MKICAKTYCALSLACLALCAVLPARGQDTIRIERVEVVAARKAEARSAMSFAIDSTILRAAAGSSTADLLRQSTPLVVRDYGRGARQSVSFRGAAATHTSLYWNSMKINSPISGDVDFSLLPVYAIDKINVAPGVSAISYGDGALGGVVAIESRPDWSKRLAVDALVGVGSFSSYDAMAAVRAGTDRFQSSTKVIYNYSLNDFEFVNRDIIDPSRPSWRPTVRNKNADYQNIGITQDFFLRLNDDQSLSVSAMVLDNQRNVPQLTTYEGPDNSNLTRSTERSARAAVTYKRFGALLSIEAMLGATIEDYSFIQQNFLSDHYVAYIDSRSFGRSLNGAINLTFSHVANHTFRTETAASITDAHSTEEVRKTGFNRSRAEFSQSVGWYATWHPKWSTSLVGRGGIVGAQWYGTASGTVDYSPIDILTISLRGGYNQHIPSLSDLYYTPGGNPDLRPERGTTAELGARLRWHGIEANANVYASIIDDWIIWMPTFAQYWTPVNLRNVFSAGFEFQASFNHSFDAHWRIAVGGSIALTRTVNIGEPIGVNDFSAWQQLPFIPLVSGSAYATGWWRNVSVGYRVEGEGEKSNTINSAPSNTTTISPFDIHTLWVDYAPWQFLSIRAECRNLFDGRFYGVMRRPLPPRSFSLTLRFQI